MLVLPTFEHKFQQYALHHSRRDDGRLSAARPSSSVAVMAPIETRARSMSKALLVVHSHRQFLRPKAASLGIKMALLLAALVFIRPVSAASVAFENCLPESYIENKPTPLQWIPLYVDASFNTEDPSHELTVTMWGNVTGSSTNVTLPAWNSTDWDDPSMLDGKILDTPDPAINIYTTLRTKVNVLTYEPWNQNTRFCNGSLENATCPLGPVFNVSTLSFPYTLPSVTMSEPFNSSYAFTSFSVTFIIKYGDSQATDIGCVSAVITPDLGNLAWMLKILPLIVLLFVGVATVFAGIFSPWGTTDIFHWSSNYGRHADLLRLVTPGFCDCLQYIQFVALTGGLTLNYPGFYQPIVSQASWSALMFNQSFVSKSTGWVSLTDGIYFLNGTYGLQDLGQLAGIANVEDIWAGMMIWVLVIIAATIVLVQGGFCVQWVYRAIQNIPEEDLRRKNVPFTLGNIVRVVLNYFLMPIVALSTFQLVVAADSPPYTVALAVLTLIIILGFSSWVLYLVATTKPRAFLFDDLPTLLLYGPLYNTYSDEAAAFALVPIFCTFLRGIAIGAVQPSGVAQLVVLAICEIVQIMTLHAFRPFNSQSSMNAYHTLFSALRLVTVLLMVAFVPSLGVTEGPKGWIGYAILLCHAGVLVLGFFLNALQTLVEVLARMLGAGGDDLQGQSRGGLSKIFGMRQLSRRMSRREAQPSRQSQLSSSAMLDAEDASKSGYVMAAGRIRSESASGGSMGVLIHHRQRSSSGLADNLSIDGPSRYIDSGASSFTPTTQGETVFSFLPSPNGQGRFPPGAAVLQSADPYYRPPRARRPTIDNSSSPAERTRGSWNSADWSQRRLSQPGGLLVEPQELDDQISRGATPAPYSHPSIPFAPRTDYSTREVDFYYGVRGERLNSDAPGRKLGTGPADPNGPMSSAAGWLRTMFGGKSREKGKGFEVVRSSRVPPAMRARGIDFDEEVPPEGIPVAMGVIRNGPIESDDEGHGPVRKKNINSGHMNSQSSEAELLNKDGTPQEDELDELDIPRAPNAAPVLPDVDAGGSISLPSRIQSKASRYTSRSDRSDGAPLPEVPRRSSKRAQDHLHKPSSISVGGGSRRQPGLVSSATISSRLPFERTNSQKRLSGSSMGATEDFSHSDLQEAHGIHDERPTSYGYVQQGSVNRVDQGIDLLGSSAEVIEARR